MQVTARIRAGLMPTVPPNRECFLRALCGFSWRPQRSQALNGPTKSSEPQSSQRKSAKDAEKIGNGRRGKTWLTTCRLLFPQIVKAHLLLQHFFASGQELRDVAHQKIH